MKRIYPLLLASLVASPAATINSGSIVTEIAFTSEGGWRGTNVASPDGDFNLSFFTTGWISQNSPCVTFQNMSQSCQVGQSGTVFQARTVQRGPAPATGTINGVLYGPSDGLDMSMRDDISTSISIFSMTTDPFTVGGAGVQAVPFGIGGIMAATVPSSTWPGRAFVMQEGVGGRGVVYLEWQHVATIDIQGNGVLTDFVSLKSATWTFIPEPGTWAMLVSGLALVAAGGWRRRRTVS